MKEATLYAVGSLLEEIQPYKQLRTVVEPMLREHVLPALAQSQQPFLRMRALWLYGEFTKEMKFHDDLHLTKVVEHMYLCLLQDAALPVRLTAALALTKVVQNERACELLKPHLKEILEAFLRLMTEIESEELVNSLEELVSLYRDDISVFAVQLTEQLVASYQRLVQTNPEDDDGESALAAQGCVVTVRRIIDSVSKNAELLARIEQLALPMLMYSLTPDGLDAIEDALDCIAMLLYHGAAVSPGMWKLFPQLLFLVCGNDSDPDGGYGFEYISQIAVAVQNFVAKDPATFLTNGGTGETFIARTFKFVERGLKINESSEHQLDGVVLMKVLIALLENLPARIDEALPYLLRLCLAQLHQKLAKNFKSMVVQTLAMCFWYNSALTFALLEGLQALPLVFVSLSQVLPQLKHDFELRRLVFGLTAIVATPAGAVPALIGEKLPFVMKELAALCGKMRDERVKVLKDNEEHLAEEAKKRAAKQGGDGGDDDDEAEDEDGFVDDDDNDDDEDDGDDEQSILNKLRKFKEKGNVLESAKDNDDEDDDDDDDDDSDYEYTGGEMAIYDSALDDVDELLHVRAALEKLNAGDAAYTGRLLAALEPAQLEAFNETMRGAQDLKDREELIRKQCDELDEQTGGNMKRKIGEDLF